LTGIRLTSFKELLERWDNQRGIPLGINFLDKILGGLLPGHLQVVCGESGVGKTWFCLRAINSMLNHRSNSEILFCDFNGHLRLSNLKKIIQRSEELDKITIIGLSDLLEQIVFFRDILQKKQKVFDLIILDTVFGSPIDSLRYFNQERKIWQNRIFFHLYDLSRLSIKWNIPILLVNHLVTQAASSAATDIRQTGEKLLEPFVPIVLFIQKTEKRHSIELRLFKELIGRTDFELIPIAN
jgi:predicted ATP-dependent serine protease